MRASPAAISFNKTQNLTTWPEMLGVMTKYALDETLPCSFCHPRWCTISVVLPENQPKRNNTTKKVIVPRAHMMPGLDEIAPSLLRAVSHDLRSIPVRFQTACHNPEAYNKNFTGVRPLFTYNPSIQPFALANQSYYIASFRVGNFPWLPLSNYTTRYPYRNYLGLALLDERLSIVVDAVFDMNEFDGYSFRSRRKQVGRFVDYRLFYCRDTLFLSHDVWIWPIEVQVGPVERWTKSETRYRIPPLYTDEEAQLSIHVWSLGRDRCRRIRGLIEGRNFNFFEVGDKLFIEQWPLQRLSGGGGRLVGKVEHSNSTTFHDAYNYSMTNEWEGHERPIPAFAGHEQDFDKRPFLYRASNDRGTACCVKLEQDYFSDIYSINTTASHILPLPYIFVGISHVKSMKKLVMSHGDKYGYLSRFYAFSPTLQPTETIAQSSLFCWGFPSTNERSKLHRKNLLKWRAPREYACPVIQFASGMTESLSDPSKLIVAYGIDDQISRMVEIRKRDVAMMLFSPAPWMGG